MPKSYGSPTGTDKPDPNRKQKAVSTPAQQTAAGKDYLEHMVQAHNAYHASNPAQQVGGSKPPRKSSIYNGPNNAASYSRPQSSAKVDKALKDSGAE